MNTSTGTKGIRRARWMVLLILGTSTAFNQAHAQPDLIVDRSKLVAGIEVDSVMFAASDCAVVEGCVNASGQRKVLRFNVGIANIGNTDLLVGNPNDHPELFEHSECHDHFHFRSVALFELIDAGGAIVASSGKRAFCLRDNVRYSASAGPSQGYNCDNQGITAGWEDVYDKSVDCQFLDVTGVPAGYYTLRVTLNPEGLLTESNYDNNAASVSLNINGHKAGKVKKPKKPKHPYWKRGHDKSWKKDKEARKSEKEKGKKSKGKKKKKEKDKKNGDY